MVMIDDKICIRRFKKDDAQTVADLIRKTLEISNSKDYTPEYIKENIESHSAQVIVDRANESHFYVAVAGDSIIGCGGITGYWGSTTESYLVTIFVLPEYQHRGVGKQMIETLEADEYFKRAWRTEVGSSLTAVDFYRRLGYQYKNNVTTPDEFGVVRLEKNTSEKPDETFRHKTLEERAAEFGGQLDLDGEYDWGEQMGREVWE